MQPADSLEEVILIKINIKTTAEHKVLTVIKQEVTAKNERSGKKCYGACKKKQ